MLPRAAAAKSRPVILFFYGGSWNSGRRQGYAFAARALAARGFVVIVPDYRLVPDAVYPDFLRDCAAAVRWARRNAGAHGGDGERIVLVGHSAGAYNAAMLALDPGLVGADRSAVARSGRARRPLRLPAARRQPDDRRLRRLAEPRRDPAGRPRACPVRRPPCCSTATADAARNAVATAERSPPGWPRPAPTSA